MCRFPSTLVPIARPQSPKCGWKVARAKASEYTASDPPNTFACSSDGRPVDSGEATTSPTTTSVNAPKRATGLHRCLDCWKIIGAISTAIAAPVSRNAIGRTSSSGPTSGFQRGGTRRNTANATRPAATAVISAIAVNA